MRPAQNCSTSAFDNLNFMSDYSIYLFLPLIALGEIIIIGRAQRVLLF